MKKNLVRSILMTLICTLLIFILTACGSYTQSPSSTASNLQTSPVPASPVQTYSSELLVFAAGGTKAPIDAAAAAFQQKYGTKLTINYGGGGEVLSNMVLAKKGDVFIAPEQKYMDSAKQKGGVDQAATPAVLAYMIPVIGVQKGNPMGIQTLDDLAKPGTKIAMGNPETTLLGVITPETLKKAGLYDTVNPNIVTNVPQVNTIITNLKTKQVDAGFIWHYFSVTNAADVDIIWIPAKYITGIGQIQAAVTTYSTQSWTAQQFINFLTSSEGQDIFKKNGYIVDHQESDRYWLSTQ